MFWYHVAKMVALMIAGVFYALCLAVWLLIVGVVLLVGLIAGSVRRIRNG